MGSRGGRARSLAGVRASLLAFSPARRILPGPSGCPDPSSLRVEYKPSTCAFLKDPRRLAQKARSLQGGPRACGSIGRVMNKTRTRNVGGIFPPRPPEAPVRVLFLGSPGGRQRVFPALPSILQGEGAGPSCTRMSRRWPRISASLQVPPRNAFRMRHGSVSVGAGSFIREIRPVFR